MSPAVKFAAARMPRPACALLLATLLVGCAGSVLDSDAEPAEVFRLQLLDGGGETPARTPTEPLPLAIAVARPRSSAALDTVRIAVVPGGHRFDYYAGVQWAEPAPQMLQQALVGALARDGRFAAVLAAPARAPTELLLDVELRRFEAVAAAGGTPVVHVLLEASLVDSRKGIRVASFPGAASQAATANRLDAVIAAFDTASAAAVNDVVRRVREASATLAPAVP